MSSSDSGMDSSDSEVDDQEVMWLIMENQNGIHAAASLLSWYYASHVDKNDPRTTNFSGMAWVMETLSNPNECYDMFRMPPWLFYKLHDELVSDFGLQSSSHMNSIECLGLFLVVCGHSWSNSAIQKDFKHSSETISRKFTDVLHCMVAMSKRYIQPKDPNFRTVHSRITNDPRMWPHFKDCIGAIDGTHITATPRKRDLIRYIGRSGKPTHNVMGVVDFDMRFTYASIGQPGSMHDTTVLYHALESDEDTFPHPPLGTLQLYLEFYFLLFLNIVFL
jgi:hypothetical protein